MMLDLVIVGSGVAGLTAARDAAAAGLSVLVVTKAEPEESSTRWAQGGVAVVRDERDPGDGVGAHIEDTLVAAAGLADPAAVTSILTDGAGAITRLQARGADFDLDVSGNLSRTREGGHSARRVIHAGGDATGAEIERALLADPGRPAVLAGDPVLELLRDADGRIGGVLLHSGVLRARAVVLATGGAGHLWAATTNPWVATGDGLALALRAGADLADVEFMQFHPTVLWTSAAATGRRPLVTEAVRGEGAVLRDATGAAVMSGVHPQGDLAPRDVVALAISRTMAAAPGGVGDHVFLDATRIGAPTFARRFPTVTAACRAAGIDPSRDPIPVAPAAHYHCGGVVTDLHGRTSVPGLYAVGEVARTGLHGANRLASNSLLEGLVMGERAARAVVVDLHDLPRRRRPPVDLLTPDRPPVVSDGGRVARLQGAMSAHAGIGRNAAGLAGALDLALRVAGDPGLATAAVLSAALTRTASRGSHVRTDARGAAVAGEDRTVLVRLIDGRPDARLADLRSGVPVPR